MVRENEKRIVKLEGREYLRKAIGQGDRWLRTMIQKRTLPVLSAEWRCKYYACGSLRWNAPSLIPAD